MQLVVMLLSFATGPIQARELGPELRGQLATVLIVGQIGAFLSDFGALGWITRQVAHGERAGSVLRSAAPLLLAAWLVAVALAFPIATMVGGSDESLLFWLLLFQILLLPFSSLVQAASGVALGSANWRFIAFVRLTGAVVPFIGLVVLLLVDEVTLLSTVVCYYLAAVAAGVIALGVWWRSRPIATDVSAVRDAWRFGRGAWLSTLLNVSNLRADGLMVAAVLDFRSLGIYAVAATLAALPGVVPAAVTQATARALSLDNLREFAAATVGAVLALAAIAASAIALTAPVLVPLLFGDEFDEAVPVVWFLLTGTVLGAAAQTLGNAITLAAKPAVVAWAQGAGVVTMLLGMAVLGPRFGILGVAAASASGYGASFALLLTYARVNSGIPVRRWLLLSPRSVQLIYKRRKVQAEQ
ncbi:lipopolysaccharide biosynthesis protein [Nocardioides sp. ChNu-153]|nr:lipopolysaccharide biosynthesis protein [Nocardioides sp. ChNu-99]MDN7122292.1 lipopolysaccharide biosynthesis protein [Nocardioides sp. ChNu-153]